MRDTTRNIKRAMHLQKGELRYKGRDKYIIKENESKREISNARERDNKKDKKKDTNGHKQIIKVLSLQCTKRHNLRRKDRERDKE